MHIAHSLQAAEEVKCEGPMYVSSTNKVSFNQCSKFTDSHASQRVMYCIYTTVVFFGFF
jgi:hypothetical protein